MLKKRHEPSHTPCFVISSLKKILFWLLRRALGGCVLAALGLACWAWWLCAHDDADFAQRRADALGVLAAESARAAAASEAADKHAADVDAELRAQKTKAAEAAQAIERHREIESDWKRFFGGREEQEINDRKREEQEKIQAGAQARIAALNTESTRALAEKMHAEALQNHIGQRIRATEAETSKWKYYARVVWDEKDGATWALIFVAFWIVWPVLRKALLYYFVAPFVIRRKPLRLSKEPDVAPALGDEGKSVLVELWPGEALRVKPALIESADEGLARAKKFWLKARYPITNLACGLVRLAELRHTRAGAARQVVLRGAGKWTGAGRDTRGRRAELAVVQVPEGGSLVLRPRYLAGVVKPVNAPFVVRSRWRIFSLHAWVTGQFRFFEFAGPCRLIVASQRGVQAETLAPREDGRRPVRRANAWATIGFTPMLRYRPARAESFWGYVRGLNPLYDDLFIGEGMFFVQKTAIGQGRYDKGLLRRFAAGCWRGFQKIFGM